MLRSLDYGWRLIATAISFFAFGLGGLMLRVVCFPLMRLLLRNTHNRVRYVRLVVHYSFRGFIWLMRTLGVLRYRIIGVEKLNRSGLLILSNHPTLIDVVFLISLVPNASCVVKSMLARNPFTRGPVTAADYICNDVGSGLIEDCIRSVGAGHNLIVFPEGTRTPVDGRMRLQRGAANIAVRGAYDITPVVIRCEPLCLTKGRPWWKIPARRADFIIEVKDDIPVAPFIEAAHCEAALAARRLTDYLGNYFHGEKVVNASA